MYVTDENDNFPQFDQASYEASVKEHSAPDTFVTQIRVSQLPEMASVNLKCTNAGSIYGYDMS